ncbi:MAG: DUF1353 domain-containing protein [Cytophagales bacterium]|nr:DUF1353 domain-containing protein [Cytophagales bacterium]
MLIPIIHSRRVLGHRYKQELDELTRPAEYRIGGFPLVVPRGFRTNGASVPWLLRWFLHPKGWVYEAALLHDYCVERRLGYWWSQWVFWQVMAYTILESHAAWPWLTPIKRAWLFAKAVLVLVYTSAFMWVNYYRINPFVFK